MDHKTPVNVIILCNIKNKVTARNLYIRGPFAKSTDSPYYSELELRGGAVTVSFSKYLPCQEMPFLQRSIHFSKTCCRPLITSKFLASELPFHGCKKKQKLHGARSELNSVFCLGSVDRWKPIRRSAIQSRCSPMRFLGFSNHEKEATRQEISKWSMVYITFSRSGWSVVRNASLAEGGTSKKGPSPHLHNVPTRSNKLSPRTFQTSVMYKPTFIWKFM
jgi:hypothetical protein